MKRIIGVALLTISTLFSGGAVAQDASQSTIVIGHTGESAAGPVVVVQARSGGSAQAGTIEHSGEPDIDDLLVHTANGIVTTTSTVNVGGTEFLFEGKPVKGAPFSAEAVTETVQMLADGNRITNSSSTKLYRDSEGRTRRELSQDAQTMTVLPFPGPKMGRPEVMISDPVAGANYMLNTKSRTAMKLPVPQHVQKTMKMPEHAEAGSKGSSSSLPRSGAPEHKTGVVALPSGNNMIFTTRMPGTVTGDFKAESLGKQTIEGVEAQGERVTETIPAGRIGNELPIVSTSETWFSPRLQRVVLSRRHDPRFGDTTFKLTNITLAEPSPALFQVPSDYTITDPRAEAERMRKEAERMRKEFQRMKPELDKMRKDFERRKPEFERLQSDAERIRHEVMESLSDLPR